MKFFLAAAVLILIAFSVWADYRWKKWMAARKADRDQAK
jgi:hypothetical protein